MKFKPMAMSETYDEQLLLGYVEGELGKADQARVERMIAQDARLGRLLEQLQADRRALRRLPEPEVPAWLMEEAIARLERSMLLEHRPAEVEARVNHKRNFMQRMVVAMAVAAMLLMCSYLVIDSLITVRPPESQPSDVAGGPAMTDVPAWPAGTDGTGADSPTGPGSPSRPATATGPTGSIAEQGPAGTAGAAMKGAGDQAPTASQEIVGKAVGPGGPQPSGSWVAGPDVAGQAQPLASKAMTPAGQSSALTVQTGQVVGPVAGPDEQDQPIELSQLVRRMDQLSPEELAALELVVKTSNVKQADEELNRATAQVEGSNLMGPLASDNGQHRLLLEQAQHMRRINYNLKVPVDRFDDWLRQISRQQGRPDRQDEAPAGGQQQIFFQRRVVRQLQLERTWPSDRPDYQAILSEQLPLETVVPADSSDRTQAPASRRYLTIPVIIDNMQAGEQPPAQQDERAADRPAGGEPTGPQDRTARQEPPGQGTDPAAGR